MTNREKLMLELTEITSEDLFTLLFGHNGVSDRLERILGGYQCADCKAKCGGECPARLTEEDCGLHGLSPEAWLDLPCKRERLVDWEDVFK